jgi:hypothetical protein
MVNGYIRDCLVILECISQEPGRGKKRGKKMELSDYIEWILALQGW